MVYCSKICKASAAIDRAHKKAAERKAEKRATLARAARMWRAGAVLDEVAAVLGWAPGSASGHMLQSRGYRRRTKKRKAGSRWYSGEAERNARSKQFRLETEFSLHAAEKLSEVFDDVRREVCIPGTRRKIDVVVTHGLWRFGVELKNGNRTARLDQTLGQAIIKCNALGRLTPVCCVPDDVTPDHVFLAGCRSVGAIAGTLKECIESMAASCGRTRP